MTACEIIAFIFISWIALSASLFAYVCWRLRDTPVVDEQEVEE